MYQVWYDLSHLVTKENFTIYIAHHLFIYLVDGQGSGGEYSNTVLSRSKWEQPEKERAGCVVKSLFIRKERNNI